MLNPNALVTYTELTTALDIPNDSKQTEFESLINAASNIADSVTGRILKASDYTEIMDGSGTDTLIIPNLPLNSVTELNIDPSRKFLAETIIDSDYYAVRAKYGLIHLFNRFFPREKYTVKLTYNAGFDPVPEDLKIAVIEIVQFLYNRRNSKMIGRKSVNANDVQETWELTIPLNATKILQGYKI